MSSKLYWRWFGSQIWSNVQSKKKKLNCHKNRIMFKGLRKRSLQDSNSQSLYNRNMEGGNCGHYLSSTNLVQAEIKHVHPSEKPYNGCTNNPMIQRPACLGRCWAIFLPIYCWYMYGGRSNMVKSVEYMGNTWRLWGNLGTSLTKAP